MIKSITLKNWKSFGEATLYVDPLTVLIGTNASGKSNFLDALVFLGELAKGRRLNEALTGTGNGYKGIRGGKDAIIRKGELAATITIVFFTPKEDASEFRYEVSICKDDKFGYIIAAESLSLLQKKQEIRLFTFHNQEHTFLEMDVARWATEAIKEPTLRDALSAAEWQLRLDLKFLKIIDPIPQNMRTYSELSNELAVDGSNLAGYMAGYFDKQALEEGLSTVLKKLPENEILRIWAEPVGRLGADAMLYCEERWPGKSEPFLVDARGISDGTLRLVAILTALLTAERGSTVAIEEVDNGIHPSRAELLVKLLHKIGAERKVDIICTTHNPALLDAFGNEMIPSISLVYRDKKTGASQIKLLEDLKNLPRLMARGSVGLLATKGILEEAANK